MSTVTIFWIFNTFPAYHVVSQSYGLNDTTGSGDETDASDLEVMDVSMVFL